MLWQFWRVRLLAILILRLAQAILNSIRILCPLEHISFDLSRHYIERELVLAKLSDCFIKLLGS